MSCNRCGAEACANGFNCVSRALEQREASLASLRVLNDGHQRLATKYREESDRMREYAGKLEAEIEYLWAQAEALGYPVMVARSREKIAAAKRSIPATPQPNWSSNPNKPTPGSDAAARLGTACTAMMAGGVDEIGVHSPDYLAGMRAVREIVQDFNDTTEVGDILDTVLAAIDKETDEHATDSSIGTHRTSTPKLCAGNLCHWPWECPRAGKCQRIDGPQGVDQSGTQP